MILFSGGNSIIPTVGASSRALHKSQLCLPKLYADRNNSNVHFYAEEVVNECGGKRLQTS